MSISLGLIQRQPSQLRTSYDPFLCKLPVLYLVRLRNSTWEAVADPFPFSRPVPSAIRHKQGQLMTPSISVLREGYIGSSQGLPVWGSSGRHVVRRDQEKWPHDPAADPYPKVTWDVKNLGLEGQLLHGLPTLYLVKMSFCLQYPVDICSSFAQSWWCSRSHLLLDKVSVMIFPRIQILNDNIRCLDLKCTLIRLNSTEILGIHLISPAFKMYGHTKSQLAKQF